MRFNRELLQAVLQRGDPLHMAANRATGRSTILALRLVAEAIDSGGEWIEVRDHWDTRYAHQHLLGICQDIVSRMGLRQFEFNSARIALRCNFAEAL